MKLRERKRELLSLLTTVLFSTLILGLTLSFIPKIVRNVSAVTATSGIGVYWDSRCVNTITSISWGNLTPGTTREIYVYIRNEQKAPPAPVILLLTTINWAPQAASRCISLSWSYGEQWVNPDEVVKVSLKLSISNIIQGITDFNFNINIDSSLTLPGDLNKDGRVDYKDYFIFSRAYGSTPTSPNWDSAADINGDDEVNYVDLYILRKFYTRY